MVSDEPSDEAPICSECGDTFSWNENADRDDPRPLCNPCAHDVASRAAEIESSLAGLYLRRNNSFVGDLFERALHESDGTGSSIAAALVRLERE